MTATIHHLPVATVVAQTLPITTRMALSACRWWFWALRADCSAEWDHVISRLEGAIAAVRDIDECNTLRFLRDLAAEHSERCYHNEQTIADLLADDHAFLKHQAD